MAQLALADLLETLDAEQRGELAQGTVFRRVEVDVAAIGPGDLFVAVPDERIDGHELTPVAALRGAAAAVVSSAWAAGVRELALPLLVVDDPVAALQRLAAARRARLVATVVGITGSVGKTSTKEVVAAVLGQRLATYRSPGNRNNEIGLPLSLLAAPDRAEAVVLELGGAYAAGELALLASIARPQIGVVTNVDAVHVERMGSLEAIARTKAEVVEALPADGVAVLNGDDARVRAMAERTDARVLTYGRDAGNDVRAVDVRLLGLAGSTFRLRVAGEAAGEVTSPLLAPHGVELALAALTVGHALELGVEELLPGLTEPGLQVRLRPRAAVSGALLLDDTYNASPPSVRSALELLASCGARRRIAVLGDMLELGAAAEAEHRAAGREAARAADLLVVHGELAMLIADAADAERAGGAAVEVVRFPTARRAELVAFLRSELREGDVALIKGSRSLRLEEVVEALTVTTEGDTA